MQLTKRIALDNDHDDRIAERIARQAAEEALRPPVEKMWFGQPYVPTPGTTPQASHVQQLNVTFYNPIRGILATPPDCWQLDQFDWTPLPSTDHQRAHTSATAASGQKVEHYRRSHPVQHSDQM